MKLLPLARAAMIAGLYQALSHGWGLDALQAGTLSLALYTPVAFAFARRRARPPEPADTPQLPALRPPVRPMLPSKPRNPMIREDKRLHDTVATAWAIAAQKQEPKAPGSCQAIVSTTGEFGLHVVRWKMELLQPPTREVVRLIENELVLNLRYILNDEEVSTALHGREIHIELPSPFPMPSTHLSNMLRYAHPGMPVEKAPQGGDITGLIGVDNDRRVVRVEMAEFPIILYIGSPGSGKTSSLKGLIMSILQANEPDRVQLHVIATKPQDWLEFEQLPHTAAVALNPAERIKAISDLRKLMAQADTRESGGRTNHPSIIVVLDDLSIIAESEDWPKIRGDIVALVNEGRQKRIYTVITTHRWTVEGGLGSRSLYTAAQMRVAFATGGGHTEYGHILGDNTKGRKLPSKKGEALISQYGAITHHITSVYVDNGELANIISAYDEATIATNNDTLKQNNLQGSASRMGGECKRVSNDGLHATTDDFSRENGCSSNYNGNTIYNGDTSDGAGSLQDATSGIERDARVEDARKTANRLLQVYRTQVIERDERTCGYCFRVGSTKNGPDGSTWHIDHIIPVADDGPTEMDNLVLACRTCNQSKGAMSPLEFFDKRLLELDGTVPRLRKVGRAYVATVWDCMRIWYAHTVGGKHVATIAQEAFGGSGGYQSQKVEGYISVGREQYERIRKHYINQDTAPGGVDLGTLLDEIERGLNDAQG